jgi:MobA/MobL family protein
LAIYYASTTPLSRRSGRSAVAAAAYRAGCRLVDARTGREHDYSRKRGVESSALILPDGESIDRELLWSAAERAEARKDARTAREWVLALPSELSAPERVELAHAFALELARRYGVAVDVAIHAPHRHGDDRNFHAHLLCTTRRVERDPALGIVLGAKVAIELGDKDRKKSGIAGRSAHDIEQLRASWAELANGALERAGRSERIDHRSLEAQGIDREPTIHLGPVATQMERRGRESDRGRILRAIRRDNREREQLAARLARIQAELRARERAAQEQAERERAELEAREAAERAAKERAAQAELEEREYAGLGKQLTSIEKERRSLLQGADKDLKGAEQRYRAARAELSRFRELGWLEQLRLGLSEKELEKRVELREAEMSQASLALTSRERSAQQEAESLASLKNAPIAGRMREIIDRQKRRLLDVAFETIREKYAGALRFSDDRDLGRPLKVIATAKLGMLSDRSELHCALLVAEDGSRVIRPLHQHYAKDLRSGDRVVIRRDGFGHESVHAEERSRDRDRGGRER